MYVDNSDWRSSRICSPILSNCVDWSTVIKPNKNYSGADMLQHLGKMFSFGRKHANLHISSLKYAE